MTQVNIKKTLYREINAFAVQNTITVIYQNTTVDKPSEYIEPYFLFAEPADVCFDDSNSSSGILQITINTPKDIGWGRVDEIYDLLVTYFRRNTFTLQSNNVRIEDVYYSNMDGYIEDDKYKKIVEMRFQSFIN